LGLVS
jgi:hypothetical protein